MTIGNPVVILSGSGSSIASGSPTAALGGAGLNGGSLIVVCVYSQSAGTIATLTDSQSANTYTKAIQQNDGNHDCEIWYALNCNALRGNATFTATTVGGTNNYFLWAVLQIAGANGGLDKTVGTGVTNTNFNPSLTTPAGQDGQHIAIGFNVPASLTTYTEDGTWTQLGQGGPPPSVIYSYKIFTASTVTWNPSWTASTSVDGAIATFMQTAPPLPQMALLSM
jgi:hypothetical protein